MPLALNAMLTQPLYNTFSEFITMEASITCHGPLNHIHKLACLHSLKIPFTKMTEGKPWLFFCDANAHVKKLCLTLKETWDCKTLLSVAASDLVFNWRLSSAVSTRVCLL